jgi:putative transposase
VGVDFGVACSAYCSDENAPRLLPATLTVAETRRIVGLEKRKARQLTWAKRHNDGRYSKRLRRTLAEIADLRGRQARRRLDFTHKLTTDLAKNHGFVGIEDLRVLAMTASARGSIASPGTRVAAKAGLNRAILNNIWGERRRQLGYKCVAFGSELVVVAAAGTSQSCAACGRRDPDNREGCGRVFACVHCGHTDHADRNAALNIEALAAGRAVNSTRSRQLAARPSGSRLREPFVETTP